MAGNSEINHSAQERIISPEKYILTIPYITISGPSGTGKTHTAEILAERFGVVKENFFKTGDYFRKIMEERGSPVEGFVVRELTVDEKLDIKQRQLMLEATIDEPWIIEGRLAGIIHEELKQEREQEGKIPPSGISLLFVCDETERRRRLVVERGEDALKNEDRDTKDFAQWQQVHPMLRGRTITDLYSATTDSIGNLHNEMYDIVVDTSHRSIDEVADFIIEKFVSKGYAHLK